MNAVRARMDEYRRQRQDQPAGKGAVVFFVLFGIFWCGIVGTFDAFMIPAFLRQVQSTWFKPTPARILTSELKHERDSDGSSYNVKMTYRYKVDGVEYTSDRFKFDKSSSSDGKWARDAVANFPAGSDAVCYYDPNNPGRAVISKGLHGSDVFMLMFITPFNIIGLALLGYPFYAWRERRRPALVEPRERDRFGNRESYTMTPYSPLLTFVGVFFITTFLGMFATVIPNGFHPTMFKVCSIWGAAFLLSIASAVHVFLKTKAGKYDLVIDHGSKTVRIPAMHKRKTAEFVPIANIDSITTEETKTGSDSEANTEWHIKLRTRDKTEYLLDKTTIEKDAQRLVLTLNERLRA